MSGTGLEILHIAPSFLACSGTASAERSPLQLAQAHDYRGALAALGSRFSDLLVTNAYAFGGSTGIGGKIRSFSPFGVVDTLVTAQANSATQQQGPTGAPAASPPAVLVQTLGGHTPLPGANVTFNVLQGAGVLTAVGNPALVAQVSATTDTSGVARVGSWSIGVGQNIVNAIASFAPPASGVGVSVTGNPVADTATGGNVLSYLGGNYRFLLASTGDTAGFFQPGFNDAAWGLGNAAFGSGSVPGTTCPLDNTVATHWDNSIQPSVMLLRRAFPWPGKGTGTTTLTLGVAIDNDIQVYVNGTDVTPSVQGGTLQSDGYVHHEGCAAQDSFTFTVSDALLVGGNNILAVRARDRGAVAYVDARLSVATSQLSPSRVKAPKAGIR